MSHTHTHNLSKKVQRGCRTCFSIFSLLVRIVCCLKGRKFCQIYLLHICTSTHPGESEFITIFGIRKNRYWYWILVRSKNSCSEVIVFIKLNIRKRRIERWNSKRVLWSIFASLPAQSPGLGTFIEIFEYNITILLHFCNISFLLFFLFYWCFNTLLTYTNMYNNFHVKFILQFYIIRVLHGSMWDFFFFLNFHIHINMNSVFKLILYVNLSFVYNLIHYFFKFSLKYD